MVRNCCRIRINPCDLFRIKNKHTEVGEAEDDAGRMELPQTYKRRPLERLRGLTGTDQIKPPPTKNGYNCIENRHDETYCGSGRALQTYCLSNTVKMQSNYYLNYVLHYTRVAFVCNYTIDVCGVSLTCTFLGNRRYASNTEHNNNFIYVTFCSL